MPDQEEGEFRKLCGKLNLSFSVTKDAFWEFKETKGAVIAAEFCVDTVPVSMAACKRGFSAMNTICTPLRSLLIVSK